MKFREFVRRIVEILERSGVEYVIVGGLAAIYYGEPRGTQDVDVIVNLLPEDEKLDNLCDLFGKEGFHIIGGCEAVKEALKSRSHVTIFDPDYIFRVDLQGVYTELNLLALEGRRRVRIFGLDAWLQGPEDLIIAKLTLYLGNRDIRDVLAILKNSRDIIDWERLKRLARRFNVEGVLAKLMRELGLETP